MPRWLDDEMQGREWAWIGLGALATTAVTALALLWWQQRSEPEDAPATPPAPRAAAVPAAVAMQSVAAAEAAAPAAVSTATAAPPAACPHQRLDLLIDGERERACVATTRSELNGSTRSHLFDPEGVSRWMLRVDAVGSQVVEVHLSTQGGEAYSCAEGDCTGLAIGKPDRWGLRSIDARDAALRSSAGASLLLTASLTAAPAEQECAAASLRIVETSGSVTELCPGSAGFELLDDGRRRYLFSDDDGRALRITVADGAAIDGVELDDGWSCRGSACAGVSSHMHGAAPGAAAVFSFAGTTLFAAPPSRRTAALDGSVALPAQ